MKKLLQHTTLVLLAGLLWAGCRKELPVLTQPDAVVPASMTDVFDAYWQGMNYNYVFWDVDTTNWDRVYTQYRPLFASLSMTDTADLRKAHTYFGEMVRGLSDGHYYIEFSNPFMNGLGDVYPQRTRDLARITPLPFSHFDTYIRLNYLKNAQTKRINYTQNTRTGTLQMVTGIINPGIAYFRFSAFWLSWVAAQTPSEFYTVWNAFIANALDVSKSPKGLILDLRSNGGGATSDLDFVTNQFVGQSLIFAQTHIKSGPGRLDHSPWMDAIVTPAAGAKAYDRPIVVLTDRYTASMAEITAMAFRSLPGIKVTIVGDTTQGANGPLSPSVDLFNGGQFTFADFGFVYTSSAAYRYKGTSYEGRGFPPDVYIPFVYAPGFGTDRQLDEAIRLLK